MYVLKTNDIYKNKCILYCMFVHWFFLQFPKMQCLHIFILIKEFLYCCYFCISNRFSLNSLLAAVLQSTQTIIARNFFLLKSRANMFFLKHFMSPLTSQPSTINLFNFVFFLSISLKIKLNRKNELERDALGFWALRNKQNQWSIFQILIF